MAILAIVACIGLISWRPVSGPSAVSEPESTFLLEMQTKLIAGLASIDRAKAIEGTEEMESLAGSPSGAQALAALYLYLGDETLRAKAKTFLEEAPDDSTSYRLLLEAVSGPVQWDAEDLAALRRELGWFGELAAAPVDADARANVHRVGQRMVLIFGAAGLGAVLLFGLGSLLLLVAIFHRDRIRFRLDAGDLCGGIYLQAFALYLWVMVGGGMLAGLAGGGTVVGSVIVIALALVVGLLYPVVRGVPWRVMRQQLGLHWGAGLFREALAGVVTYVTMLPVMAIGLFLTMALQALVTGVNEAPQAISHPIVGIMKDANWSLVVILGALAAVQGPIVEEIMFRGALYGAWRSRLGRILALLIMAFCFAVVHPQGLLAVPALMGIAIAFGLMREWRGSLIAGIVAHGLHNAALIGFMALAMGR